MAGSLAKLTRTPWPDRQANARKRPISASFSPIRLSARPWFSMANAGETRRRMRTASAPDYRNWNTGSVPGLNGIGIGDTENGLTSTVIFRIRDRLTARREQSRSGHRPRRGNSVIRAPLDRRLKITNESYSALINLNGNVQPCCWHRYDRVGKMRRKEWSFHFQQAR